MRTNSLLTHHFDCISTFLLLVPCIQGYVSEVLENAKVYSEHASKNKVDVDDVRLAIQSKVNFSFTGPPPRE
ncbi:hypothetical protein SARC_16447, partial [Sphaeroforma arctica JP610]